MKSKLLSFAIASALITSSLTSHAGNTVRNEVRQKVAAIVIDPSEKQLWNLFLTLKKDSKEALNKLENYPSLKSYGYLDLRRLIFDTKESEQKRLVQEMKFAKNQLTNSKLVQLKRLQDQLQMEITQLRKDNTQLKIRHKQAVSEEELSWMMAQILPFLPEVLAPDVKERLNATIERNEVLIQQRLSDQAFVRAELVKSLRSYGIQVDDNQANLIFATVTGDQDLELISAYDTIRKLVVLVQSQLQPQTTSVELGREYYGMYALMLAALLQIHESQIEKINLVFIPRIEKLLSQAVANRKQATSLLENSINKEMLKANIRASDKMIEVAKVYRDFLKTKSAKIAAASATRKQLFLEVLNTYSTYDVAQGILETIQMAQQSMEALDSINLLEAPAVLDMGDAVLLQQMTQISVEIGQK